MKLNDIPKAVAAFHSAGRVVGFFGAPGLGKTALVREGAQKMSASLGKPVAVAELHLASMSEVDIRGYLIPNGNESTFTEPPFWNVVKAHEYGVLFLDEFVQGAHEVQKACAPLLLDRRIGDYQLPPGWSVVLAGNRIEDNAGANSLLSHVLNRIAYVEIEADIEGWIAWGARQGLDPLLLAFAKLRPGTVFSGEPPVGDTPWCTPRSLHALDDVAKSYGGVRAMLMSGSDSGREIAAGLVGKTAAHEIAAIIATADLLPSYEAIIKDPTKIKLPTAMDAKYVALTMVAMRAEKDDSKPVVQYITRFDPNFALIGMVMLIQRMPQAAVHAAKWVQDNAALLGEYRRFL